MLILSTYSHIINKTMIYKSSESIQSKNDQENTTDLTF